MIVKEMNWGIWKVKWLFKRSNGII